MLITIISYRIIKVFICLSISTHSAWAIFRWRLSARFHQPDTNKLQVTKKLDCIRYKHRYHLFFLCIHVDVISLSDYSGKHFIQSMAFFLSSPAMDQLSIWWTLLWLPMPVSPMTPRLLAHWPELLWVGICHYPSSPSMAQVGCFFVNISREYSGVSNR